MKLGIIGGGNLGATLAAAMLAKRVVNSEDLFIVEKSSDRLTFLKSELKCKVVPGIDAQISGYDAVLLAVKPQDFSATAGELGPLLRSDQMIISIMAGVTVQKLSKALNGHRLIVRSMPNLPAKIGKGMTVFTVTPDVLPKQKAFVEAIFGSFGECLTVQDERLLDAATAVSASGPGYVFYLIESMIAAAIELGFTPGQADLLTYQTFSGATELWHSSNESAASLRKMVTSKGGTTEAAIKIFDDGKMMEAFKAGIMRAAARARELS